MDKWVMKDEILQQYAVMYLCTLEKHLKTPENKDDFNKLQCELYYIKKSPETEGTSAIEKAIEMVTKLKACTETKYEKEELLMYLRKVHICTRDNRLKYAYDNCGWDYIQQIQAEVNILKDKYSKYFTHIKRGEYDWIY